MINQQLIDFIKQQLQKGLTKEIISSQLISNGWNIQEIEEGFREIEQTVQNPNNTKKRKNKKVIVFSIVVLLFIISGGLFAYLLNKSDKLVISNNQEVIAESQNKQEGQFVNSIVDEEQKVSLPEEDKKNMINNELTNEISVPNINNSGNTEQKSSIQILSLKTGQQIISGSTIIVQYEVIKDKTSGMVTIGGKCTDEFFGNPKSKGIYSFECKIPTKLGPINASVVEVDYSDLENTKDSRIVLEVVAPTNIQPVEFSIYPDSKSMFAIVGNDSSYIAVSIKYSDNIIREIPFGYLKYSLDDPSLISFVHTEKIENAYTQHYIANKGGKTVLHLEYKGLKKDIPIEACSMTGGDYPC